MACLNNTILDTQQYTQLVNYARKCLPATAFLEPADIVSEAYLKVGSTSHLEISQAIKTIAYGQRGLSNVLVPFREFTPKLTAVVETTRVCRCCQQELGINSFYKRVYKDGRSTIASACKFCENKQTTQYRRNRNRRKEYNQSWGKLKADPIKYALYRNKRTKSDAHLSTNAERVAAHYQRIAERQAKSLSKQDRKRQAYKTNWQALKADPQKLAEHNQKRKARFTDPVRYEARKQYYKNWRLTQKAKLAQLPVHQPSTTAQAA